LGASAASALPDFTLTVFSVPGTMSIHGKYKLLADGKDTNRGQVRFPTKRPEPDAS
jgi:hypothetical protein